MRLRLFLYAPLLALALCGLTAIAPAADRPNIVFIVSEDNSIHYLDHFFEGGADTPNIKELAAHGLTFDNAFSNAPVCSVARTTLATMCYGPRVGTQYHRRYAVAEMGERRMFYQLLGEGGYYCTNHKKTDFNARNEAKVFDKGNDWRARPDDGQPFFHMESHAQSHEGSLHFGRDVFDGGQTTHNPAEVELAPYFPDSAIFRFTHAKYLDHQLTIDEIVGRTVAKLEEDGLLEDTFVFYFGDHGGVLPRGKGYAYESGLHVPLVVRVPENFRQLAGGAELGSRHAGSVSFIDFGATALQLAGLEVPAYADGRPFLGEGVTMDEVNSRDTSFGYADRMDEKYDLVRTVRVGKYHYMRCFQPHLFDGLQNNYRYRMLGYQDWRERFQAGELNEVQAQFFSAKAPELLFDCEADPHNVHNLADDPAHQKALRELRTVLHDHLCDTNDLSFYPESHMVREAMGEPVGFGLAHTNDIRRYADIADLALAPFGKAEEPLRSAMASDDPVDRYWACAAAIAHGRSAAKLAPAAAEIAASDPYLPARIRAAEFIGTIGHSDPQPALAEVVNTGTAVEATEAYNAIIYFRDRAEAPYPIDVSTLHPAENNDGTDRRMEYLTGQPKGKKK